MGLFHILPEDTTEKTLHPEYYNCLQRVVFYQKTQLGETQKLQLNLRQIFVTIRDDK